MKVGKEKKEEEEEEEEGEMGEEDEEEEETASGIHFPDIVRPILWKFPSLCFPFESTHLPRLSSFFSSFM